MKACRGSSKFASVVSSAGVITSNEEIETSQQFGDNQGNTNNCTTRFCWWWECHQIQRDQLY